MIDALLIGFAMWVAYETIRFFVVAVWDELRPGPRRSDEYRHG